MAERKKNFTEFLEQEGEAGVENIATIYATTDVFTTIRQMSEEYGITESAVSKILEYAITNCLISYQTCLAIVEKSHRNQARHIGKGESKSTPSSKHYDKLLKKRMEYVRTMRGVVPIRVFQFYINNPLLRKYNNKIDRNEAKNLKISSCLNNLDLGKEKGDIKKKFIESWKKIKSKCRQYLCKPKMPELDITEENFEQLTLNYFLPDDGELGGGMYLASAYKYFIEIQNEFINNMMNILDINSPIKAYSFQLSQEIKVQETTEDDLLNLRKIHEKINKLITRYSMRDIFKDGKINFKGFKMPVIYNFNAIEKELVRNLLPGVKKFVDEKSEEPIKFMTYKYEAFRGNRSSIITNYNLKYSPRELSQEEENLLIEFIENENNIIDVLSTCQILIDFIQGENYDKNKTIYSVIINLPKYIELNENFVNFIEDIGEKEINLKNNQKIFSIDTLINIYDIIEYICWNQFKNNLNEQYNLKVSDLPQYLYLLFFQLNILILIF